MSEPEIFAIVLFIAVVIFAAVFAKWIVDSVK